MRTCISGCTPRQTGRWRKLVNILPRQRLSTGRTTIWVTLPEFIFCSERPAKNRYQVRQKCIEQKVGLTGDSREQRGVLHTSPSSLRPSVVSRLDVQAGSQVCVTTTWRTPGTFIK